MESTEAIRRKRRRAATTLYTQELRLEQLIGPLPGDDVVYKIVSFSDLTAAGFLRYIAGQTEIDRLDVSTFRVGPKTLKLLRWLGNTGRLQHARLVVGQIMQKDKRKSSAIQYWEDLCALCRQFGWEAATRDNHTNLLLADTPQGKYVLEGSCNLSEAANWEQFSFRQDAALYDFYLRAMGEMLAPDRRGQQCVGRSFAHSVLDDPAVPLWRDFGTVF